MKHRDRDDAIAAAYASGAYVTVRSPSTSDCTLGRLAGLSGQEGCNAKIDPIAVARSLAELYGRVLPFVAIIVAVILLITYVPALTLWPLD